MSSDWRWTLSCNVCINVIHIFQNLYGITNLICLNIMLCLQKYLYFLLIALYSNLQPQGMTEYSTACNTYMVYGIIIILPDLVSCKQTKNYHEISLKYWLNVLPWWGTEEWRVSYHISKQRCQNQWFQPSNLAFKKENYSKILVAISQSPEEPDWGKHRLVQRSWQMGYERNDFSEPTTWFCIHTKC